MELGTHAVKVQVKGRGRREFLTPKGSLTHLRVHAMVTSEDNAKLVADSLVELNDEVESAEAVAFWPMRKKLEGGETQ